MAAKIKIAVVIGARPQFIKHAAFEIAARDVFDLVTIHTGQHYDSNMSAVFFDELGISNPSYMLDIGSANHGIQTGRMMIAIEEILEKEQPDWTLVYGDTNSTLAGALVSAKLDIPVVHVEAGVRSYNRSMPEEINRVLTDQISSMLFCPIPVAVENLAKEGIVKNVFLTGDIMFDMIRICEEKGLLKPQEGAPDYYYATIHRPYNTDDKDRLFYILDHLNALDHKVVFSLHPRTRHKLVMSRFDFDSFQNIEFIEPVSYFDNIRLQFDSRAVITDSGGMQKEAYMLRKKCVTIRSETEWPETLVGGWNTLLFNDLTPLQRVLTIDVLDYQSEIYGRANTAEQIINLIRNQHEQLFSTP